jgi:hypothetical protein
MKEYVGLEKLKSNGTFSTYCPKCNNPLEVVQSGFIGGEYFYCSKEKKVLGVLLKEITKVNPQFIEDCEFRSRIKKVKEKISGKNIDQIEELLGTLK